MDTPSAAWSAYKSDTSIKLKPSLVIAQVIVEIAGSVVCTRFVKLLLLFNFLCAWVDLYSRLFDVKFEHDREFRIVAFSSALFLHVLSVTTAVLGVLAYGKIFASQWPVLPNVFFSAVEVIAFIVSFQHPAMNRAAMLWVPITASARLVIDLLAPVTAQKFANACHQLSTKHVHLSLVQAAISDAAAHTHGTKCDALLDCAATVDAQKKQSTAWAEDDLYLFLNLALVTLTNSTHKMSWSAAQAVLLEVIAHLNSSHHSAPDGFNLLTAIAFGARYLVLTSWCRFALFCFMALLSGVMMVVESQCIAGLTGHAVKGRMHEVLRLAAAYCLLNIAHSGIRITIYGLEAKLVPRALAHVQQLMASLIFSKDAAYFSQFSVEFLATMFTSNLASLEALWVAMLSKLILPAMQLKMALLFVVLRSPEIAVLALTVLPPIMVLGPMGRSVAAVLASCSCNVATIARFKNGLKCCQLITVHAGQEEWIGQHFEPMVMDQARKHSQARLWVAWSHCFRAELVRNFTALNVVIFACMLSMGKLSLSSFAGYVTLFLKVRDPGMELCSFIHSALGSAGPAVRLQRVLLKTMAHHEGDAAADETSSTASVAAGPLAPLAGGLEVSELFFAYPQQIALNTWSLRGVSFRLDPGEFAVLRGPSGAGKTTLTSVLSTWLRPTSGRIRLGDAELRAAGYDSASTRRFRERLAFVPAEPLLFHASVADNITFGFKGSGTGALPETVKWTLHATGCSEFVARLEDGHNTQLPGKDGSVLSDGQAQQLCIARALHRRPRLLLLEKTLLALDTDSKERVLGTLALRSSAASELGGLIIVSNGHEEDEVGYADLLLHMELGEVRVERLRTPLRTVSCPS